MIPSIPAVPTARQLAAAVTGLTTQQRGEVESFLTTAQQQGAAWRGGSITLVKARAAALLLARSEGQLGATQWAKVRASVQRWQGLRAAKAAATPIRRTP